MPKASLRRGTPPRSSRARASTSSGPRSEPQPILDEVARFQAEVSRFALALAQDVLRQELRDRPAERSSSRASREPARRVAGASRKRQAAERPKRGRPRKVGRPAKADAKADAKARADAKAEARADAKHRAEAALPAQTSLEIATAPTTAPAPAGPQSLEPASALPSGKRRKWTRDAIVNELAVWLANGSAIDASFVTRYGPPGLPAAARRVFGRFDAALNVASLHVAKLYPDGLPAKRGLGGRRQPPMRGAGATSSRDRSEAEPQLPLGGDQPA